MGKIIYNPKTKANSVEEVEDVQVVKEVEKGCQAEARIEALIENLNSVRPIGDTDCDYAVYLEDYAYTYIYQYANTDLSCEHSAAIVGEYYPETKEVIICGVLPIQKRYLSHAEEWVNEEALQGLYDEKEKYFPGASILGWLHMQPGYGTMLTMKEVKVHRDLFTREGSLLLLVDPINRLESFHVYENEMLKEQSGYYIYYDKNPCMQQYMLDKPFINLEKEEEEDNVVNQFREIGRRRKKEYQQRKQTNFTVIAASVALLAMAAFMLRMGENDQKAREQQNQLQQQMESANVANKPNLPTEGQNSPFVFNPQTPVSSLPEEVTQGGAVVGEEESVPTMAEKIETEEAVEPEENEEAEAEDDAVAEESSTEETPKAPEKEVVEEEKQAVTKEEKPAIEKQRTYVVEEGDTLRKISMKHFNTELRTKEIIALNEIDNGDHIYVGQELKIPNK
ncbi:MAG: LysM peptidoglycan-binding domain-containing protein [Cellulosilyticaceae bacterium]